MPMPLFEAHYLCLYKSGDATPTRLPIASNRWLIYEYTIHVYSFLYVMLIVGWRLKYYRWRTGRCASGGEGFFIVVGQLDWAHTHITGRKQPSVVHRTGRSCQTNTQTSTSIKVRFQSTKMVLFLKTAKSFLILS